MEAAVKVLLTFLIMCILAIIGLSVALSVYYKKSNSCPVLDCTQCTPETCPPCDSTGNSTPTTCDAAACASVCSAKPCDSSACPVCGSGLAGSSTGSYDPSYDPTTRTFTTHQGYDLIGYDYQTPTEPSGDMCLAVCKADENCNAAVYQASTKKCFLKSAQLTSKLTANSSLVAYTDSTITGPIAT